MNDHTTEPSSIVAGLLAAGWDVRRDPEDGRIYVAKDTGGAGMCYLTPPKPERPWSSNFAEWVHPAWLSPKEFSKLPSLSPRAAYVYVNYTLTQFPDGQWEALAVGCTWSRKHRITGPDKSAVCSEFRRHWGHFNFEDEAQAFSEIFRG